MSLSMKAAGWASAWCVPALWTEAQTPLDMAELCHWQGSCMVLLPPQKARTRLLAASSWWDLSSLARINKFLLDKLQSLSHCSLLPSIIYHWALHSHTLSSSNELPGAIWWLWGSCSVFSSSTENIPFQFTTKCGLVQLKMAWSLIRWGWWVGVSRPSCHIRWKNRNCLLESAFAIPYW